MFAIEKMYMPESEGEMNKTIYARLKIKICIFHEVKCNHARLKISYAGISTGNEQTNICAIEK